MTTRRISYYDAATGEVLNDGQLVWQSRRRPSPFTTTGWIAMSQTASTDLAHAAKELGVEALSVLLLLTGKLDFENYISIAQADIARELKLRFQNVHRAMKKLISTGLIIPGPRSGKVRTYMLNPNFAWRGSTNTHAKALKASRKLRLVRPPPSKQRGGPDEMRDPYTVDWLTGKTDLEPEDTPPPVNVRPSK